MNEPYICAFLPKCFKYFPDCRKSARQIRDDHAKKRRVEEIKVLSEKDLTDEDHCQDEQDLSCRTESAGAVQKCGDPIQQIIARAKDPHHKAGEERFSHAEKGIVDHITLPGITDERVPHVGEDFPKEHRDNEDDEEFRGRTAFARGISDEREAQDYRE